ARQRQIGQVRRRIAIDFDTTAWRISLILSGSPAYKVSHKLQAKEVHMRTAGLIVSLLFLTARLGNSAESATPDWSMNASIIEACSCPMFCQCYFNAQPAAHGRHAGHSHGEGGEHFCKFNNAFKINQGSYGNTKLDGAKFWVAGDLGGDFSKGQMDWAALT